MLALNLVEQRRRDAILLAVEPVLRRAVQRVDVTRDVPRILLDPGTGAGRQQGSDDKCGSEQAHGGARRGAVSHARGIATAPMNAK